MTTIPVQTGCITKIIHRWQLSSYFYLYNYVTCLQCATPGILILQCGYLFRPFEAYILSLNLFCKKIRPYLACQSTYRLIRCVCVCVWKALTVSDNIEQRYCCLIYGECCMKYRTEVQFHVQLFCGQFWVHILIQRIRITFAQMSLQ